MVIYAVLARGLDASRTFWVFIGFLQFVLVTGGFMLGLLLAPVIAWGRGMPAEQAGGIVRFGIAYMRLFGRRVVFLILLFAGAIAGMVLFCSRLLQTLPVSTPARDALFAVLSAGGLVIVALYTYRHTVFNLAQNSALRASYAEGAPKT